MVLCCEIRIEGEEDEVFVLLPNALYLLPDEKLAKLTPSLNWCDKCQEFMAGEYIESIENIMKRIDDARSGQLDETCEFIFGTDHEKLKAAIDSWNRELHWRRMRVSPPKCLDCGSTAVRQIESTDAASLVDPRSGNLLAVSHSFAITSIDHRLSLFTSEGDFLDEVSRFAPHTHEFIDDAYPYALIVSLLGSIPRQRL